MAEIKNTDDLMLFLIKLLAEKFPQNAILKGGMSLRLLDCPRFTNDLDYIFIPFKSKKDIEQDICKVLDEAEGLQYNYSINSKCMRIKLNYNDVQTQIEINVAETCPSVPVSTESLASATGHLPVIVRIMDYSVSMANKLAAWNERQLIRDLYDLNFYYSFIRVTPDMDTLLRRLDNVGSTRFRKNPKKMTLEQLIRRLETALENLSPEDMNELSDYLPANTLPGLDVKIKANLLKMCEQLSLQ
jgi:predicted nucleotidyltransferase component of viral defense system